MPEPRDHKIMVSVEPLIHVCVLHVARKENKSNSGYVRALIIEDLLKRGVLSEANIKELILA